MGWEAFVAGKILNSWFPFIPIWGYMLLVTVALVWINLRDVKNFGEFEFWFALIKVIAIVLFLVFGSLAVMHLWPWGDASMLGGTTASNRSRLYAQWFFIGDHSLIGCNVCLYGSRDCHRSSS